MYIAKYDDYFVYADNTGFNHINFSWDSFNWPEKELNSWIHKDDFVSSISQPPVELSSKIICVGKNYEAHAKELNSNIPSEPLLFQKPTSSLLGNKGTIILPLMSKRVDYETELVILIGKMGKDISFENVEEYIFGYTIGLDITARDLQRSDSTWFRGKGFDTFAPIGPWIASPQSINLDNTEIRLVLNGEVKQIGNTKNMIFDVPYLIHYISQIVTLMPGDIIFTGTPDGIGPIKSGDILQASISKIGTLTVNVK